jgi:hypothetical protein
MKFETGPAFGALIIGCGIGFLIGQRTGNILYGIVAAVLITIADYFFILWTNSFRKK